MGRPSRLRSLVDLNVRLSRRLDTKNLSEYGAHVEYLRLAALLFSSPDVRRVLDVAAGANWHFPLHYKDGYGLHVTGVDIDEPALRRNQGLDRFVTADVCQPGGLGAEEYDLITCYSGIEHFTDVGMFLRNAFARLRCGGALLAQFPSALAPFALLNRLTPPKIKHSLIRAVTPDKLGEIGYPASYDRCRYSEFRKTSENAGFIVEYYLASYMSSGYFYPFFPIFVLSHVMDHLRLMFGTKDLASYNLFVLRKPGPHFDIKWSWHPVEGAPRSVGEGARPQRLE